MRFSQTRLPGAFEVDLAPIHDERGFFARTFCALELHEHGLESNFIQHSMSMTRLRGTLRGMHFQRAPHQEVKIVRCLKGAIWDVLVDLRPDSPSYCQWQGFNLAEDQPRQLYVPKGFAHGFQALTDNVEVLYLISTAYAPDAASGVRFDDPAFGIDWPLPVAAISEKDQSWPDFR